MLRETLLKDGSSETAKAAVIPADELALLVTKYVNPLPAREMYK
jgi:hypothetical protein